MGTQRGVSSLKNGAVLQRRKDGRTEGRKEGGTALPREGRNAAGRRRAGPSPGAASGRRESCAAERGMAGRRAVGRRAGCKYVRKTIIIVVVERRAEEWGRFRGPTPTATSRSTYSFEILMNLQLRLLKTDSFFALTVVFRDVKRLFLSQ